MSVYRTGPRSSSGRSPRVPPPRPLTESPAEVLQRLREALSQAGDPERALGMQAYMKSRMPFHGVHAPEVRRIATEVFAGISFSTPAVWRRTVWGWWSRARFREERYAVVALLRGPASRAFQDPSALALYGRLITSAAWWDLVDEIAIHCVGPVLRTHPSATRPVLRAWSTDADLWKRRTAIIAQVGAGNATDPALLARCIDPSLGSPEFFVRKAIGWALRQYARVNPTWVRRYVRQNAARLSVLSRREALRHLGSEGSPVERRAG